MLNYAIKGCNQYIYYCSFSKSPLYITTKHYLPVPKFLKLPKVHTVWRNKDIGDQFSHMEADNTFGT